MRAPLVLAAACLLLGTPLADPLAGLDARPLPLLGALTLAEEARATLRACGEGLAGAACALEGTAALRGVSLAPRSAPAAPGDAAEALATLHAATGSPLAPGAAARAVEGLDASEAAAVAALAEATTRALGEARAAAPETLDVATLRDYMIAVSMRASGGPLPAGADALLARGDAALALADATRMASAARDLAVVFAEFGPRVCEGATEEPVLDLPLFRVAGTGPDVHDALTIVQIDCGGADLYRNSAGGATGIPAISLDYGAESDDYYAAAGAAQGAANAGIGILYDEAGDERYASAGGFARGGGFIGGVGILVDGAGDDTYVAALESDLGTLAASLGGFGLLQDDSGNDAYKQWGLDGFVYGAAGGSGVMIEKGGDDTYLAPPTNVSLLGTFVGHFSGPVLVSSEVAGLALLLEEGGNDSYACPGAVRQPCQAGATVDAIALLLEDAGDDTYVLGPQLTPVATAGLPILPTGQGAGYGLATPSSPGAALLQDKAGDDRYEAVVYAQGYGSAAVGAFLDEAGTDAYAIPTHGDGMTWIEGALGYGADEAS